VAVLLGSGCSFVDEVGANAPLLALVARAVWCVETVTTPGSCEAAALLSAAPIN
jgi:hypothetical protein